MEKELDYAKITQYTYLGQFDLLRSIRSRQDIRQRPWAQPTGRRVVTLSLKIDRAQEELIRVSVEGKRVRASIHNFCTDLHCVVQTCQEEDPLLARAIEDHYADWEDVSKHLLSQLNTLDSLVCRMSTQSSYIDSHLCLASE